MGILSEDTYNYYSELRHMGILSEDTCIVKLRHMGILSEDTYNYSELRRHMGILSEDTYNRVGLSRNIWWNLQHCGFPPERQLAERNKYYSKTQTLGSLA